MQKKLQLSGSVRFPRKREGETWHEWVKRYQQYLRERRERWENRKNAM